MSNESLLLCEPHLNMYEFTPNNYESVQPTAINKIFNEKYSEITRKNSLREVTSDKKFTLLQHKLSHPQATALRNIDQEISQIERNLLTLTTNSLILPAQRQTTSLKPNLGVLQAPNLIPTAKIHKTSNILTEKTASDLAHISQKHLQITKLQENLLPNHHNLGNFTGNLLKTPARDATQLTLTNLPETQKHHGNQNLIISHHHHNFKNTAMININHPTHEQNQKNQNLFVQDKTSNNNNLSCKFTQLNTNVDTETRKNEKTTTVNTNQSPASAIQDPTHKTIATKTQNSNFVSNSYEINDQTKSNNIFICPPTIENIDVLATKSKNLSHYENNLQTQKVNENHQKYEQNSNNLTQNLNYSVTNTNSIMNERESLGSGPGLASAATPNGQNTNPQIRKFTKNFKHFNLPNSPLTKQIELDPPKNMNIERAIDKKKRNEKIESCLKSLKNEGLTEINQITLKENLSTLPVEKLITENSPYFNPEPAKTRLNPTPTICPSTTQSNFEKNLNFRTGKISATSNIPFDTGEVFRDNRNLGIWHSEKFLKVSKNLFLHRVCPDFVRNQLSIGASFA